MENQFDYIDKQILSKLRLDARKAYSQIAEELKVSNSLIHQRIKKLTAEGVIKNAEFVLEEKSLGYKTKSYTGIRLREARFAKEVMHELEKHAEAVSAISQAVLELYHFGIRRYYIHCRVANKNSRRIWFVSLFE